MKKFLMSLVIIVMLSGIVYAADQVFTLTVPDAKVAAFTQGYLKLYPNEEKNEDGTPKYTDKQWIKEQIRRIIVRDVRRGLQLISNEGAVVPPDNDIVQ